MREARRRCRIRAAAGLRWPASGAAQGGGEHFAGDDAEAAEVAGAEESDERTDEEERVHARDKGKEWHQEGGDQQVADVGVFAAPAVGDESEAEIAEEGADLHDD